MIAVGFHASFSALAHGTADAAEGEHLWWKESASVAHAASHRAALFDVACRNDEAKAVTWDGRRMSNVTALLLPSPVNVATPSAMTVDNRYG